MRNPYFLTAEGTQIARRDPLSGREDITCATLFSAPSAVLAVQASS